VIADRPSSLRAPEEATKGIVVTQFEMRAIEAVGLVKMDLLGTRALSTIQETVELVAGRHGVRLEPDAFPDPDPLTAAMFTRGDTLGVFQMESPGMRI
jgi:DNA polymerase-3 subunit alpha